MQIKVCGLNEQNNINEISAYDIDMIGLNFYEKSSRYVTLKSIEVPENIKKVGVFVNASFEEIFNKTQHFGLDYVQLHGDESAEFCRNIQEIIPVIKVFRVQDNMDELPLQLFEFCDKFLFDTYTKDYGGSGQKFDWSKLSEKAIIRPWLLSGGISSDDVEDILNIRSSSFLGVDINSHFEVSPGIKDVIKVRNFCNQLKK